MLIAGVSTPGHALTFEEALRLAQAQAPQLKASEENIDWRDTVERLTQLPIVTPMGSQITLGTVARAKVADARPCLTPALRLGGCGCARPRHNLSVATGVGFIALAGVSAEFAGKRAPLA